MQIFDNVNKTVKDDLTATISKGDKLSISAACFSIYAYKALKKQLDGIDELRFSFGAFSLRKVGEVNIKRSSSIPSS
ncbi:MAG TPA: hypothetical protein DD421_01710, partial [Clostridiaceae bacterium]|nr:hypothetical protein [Clostridiaceae bacterium]